MTSPAMLKMACAYKKFGFKIGMSWKNNKLQKDV